MKLTAVTLLRTNIDILASEIKKQVIKTYPKRTQYFDKCSRDISYILTALAECIDQNSFSSLDYVIKNFFRGGKLQLSNTEVEFWAYELAESKILNLFKENSIDQEYQDIVSNGFKTLKYHLEHGYADKHYPDNDWTALLQNKKQTVSWSNEIPDKELIKSIMREVHQHCNSKQNRVPVEIMCMDQSYPNHRSILFQHAKDQNGKHYNTQLLAPYVVLLFPRDVPSLSAKDQARDSYLEIGLIAQFIAMSATAKGISFGFCRCFDDDNRKKFKKTFKRDTPALALGLGYYEEKDFEHNPWNTQKYKAVVSNDDPHIKPPMDHYITYKLDNT